MHSHNIANLQKPSVESNTVKQRVKRDLKKLSLFNLFKQYTVKTIKELIYERFGDFGITKEDLGVKDGQGDTDYGKYNTIVEKLMGHDINSQSLVILYDEIFEKTYDKIISNLERDHALHSLLKQIHNEKFKSVFQQYFNTIKTFYSETSNQLYLNDIISPEGEFDLNNNFPIVFLPWVKDISFSDDDENNVEIAEVSTYQKILEKYDSWKDMFYYHSEQLDYVIANNRLSEIKFYIACLVNDWQETSDYLDVLKESDEKKTVFKRESVWQLILKYNLDIQKRVEFIQSVFGLAKGFGYQDLVDIGIAAFQYAAVQGDDQVMTLALNGVGRPDAKVAILDFTFIHFLMQNNNQIMDAALKKAVELNLAPKVLATALLQDLHRNNGELTTVVLDKARELNITQEVLNEVFSYAFSVDNTQVMALAFTKAVESHIEIDLSRAIEQGKIIKVLISISFQASNQNDYRVIQKVLSIAKRLNLVKEVLYDGFEYSRDNNFESFKHLWTLTDSLQGDNAEIKAIKRQVLENNDFHIPASIAKSRDSGKVKFLYEEMKKFDEDTQLKMLQAGNNEVFEELFILATELNNAEMVYDIWSKTERLVGDSDQIQRQLLKTGAFKAFRLSAEHGNKEIIEFLYSKAEKFGIQNEMLKSDQFGALRSAVKYNRRNIVEFLTKKGPDIANAIIDYNDNTVLHQAVSLNYIGIAEILLKNEAAVEAKNYSHMTPLHIAAFKNYVDIARLLIEKRANVNCADKDSDTALHLAIAEGHEDMVKLLKENGANINTKNHEGNTPLDVANRLSRINDPQEQQKYQRIINVLSGQGMLPGEAGPSMVGDAECLPPANKGPKLNKRDLKVREKRKVEGGKCLLAENEEGKIDKEKTGIGVNENNLAESEIDKEKLKAYQENLNNRLNTAIAQDDKSIQGLVKKEQKQLNKLTLEIQQAQRVKTFHDLTQEVDAKLLPALQVLPDLQGINDNISSENVSYLKQIYKISLLRTLLPLIKDRKFKNLLLNNPEKLVQEQNLLDDVFKDVKETVLQEYEQSLLELAYEGFENLENEINKKISDVREKIDQIASQNINKSNLFGYVLKSMGLNQILLENIENVSLSLRNKIYYGTLVSLGALIYDHKNHIKATHHGHEHNSHMDALKSRVRDSESLSVAHDLYYLHRNGDKLDQSKLYSKVVKNKINSYGSTNNKYIINDLFNQFSSEEIENIFNEENIKTFGAELQAYEKEVITIHSRQVTSTSNGAIQIGIKDNDGNDKNIIMDGIEDIKNPNNFSIDQEYLEIKLKLGDESYIITSESEGESTKFYLNIDGYKAKIGDLISSFTVEEKNNIHNQLHKLQEKADLLSSRKDIYDAAAIDDIAFDKQNNIINEIKQKFLKLGVRENTWKQFDEQIKNLSQETYAKYIDEIGKDLTKNGIEFDRSKFELAKIKGAKGGKFMSFLAIYDLFNSTADLKGLGDSPLNTIFGINGLLDAMDDVRESLSTQYMRSDGKIKTRLSRNGLGKITSKIPASVRKSFVRMINNPVVQGVTFATIAYQFGYSMEAITKEENIELNSYFATSSGIKLASMSVKPISMGVTAVTKGLSVATKVLKVVSIASKVLSNLSIVTSVIDVVVSIGIAIHERVEYTKAVAEQIPLLPGNEQAEVFFAEIIKPFRDVEKKYQDHITAKAYLSLFKESAIKILELKPNLGGVVEHITNIEDRYDEIIKYSDHTNKNNNMAVKDDHCQLIRNNTGFSYNTEVNKKMIDLSKLDLSDVLPLTLHTLVMTEWWEKFVCDTKISSSNRNKCHKELNDKQAYFSNLSKKHQPHLTKSEYNNGIRIISMPQSYKEFTTCTDKKNNLQYKDTYGIAGQHFKCNVDRIYRNCTQSFIFLDEPLIFTKLSRQTSQNSILYLPGPKRLTAAANYPAEMYVSKGAEEYVGSKNHNSAFIINDRVNLCYLEGGDKMAEKNIVVMNINDYQVNVVLDKGFIVVSSEKRVQSSIITLIYVYNYISNTTAQQDVTTHCKTRFVNAAGGNRGNTVRQGAASCQNGDHEVRVVHKNDTHYRGSKQTTFVISKNSGNAIISGKHINKNNTDVIKLNDVGIEGLRIREGENDYNLALLTGDRQTTNIKVDNLKNLAIVTKENQIIIIQGKSVGDLMMDMVHQKLNHSGEYVDDRILENSKTKSKAIILQNVDDAEVAKVANNIAKKSHNLSLPAQVIVTKYHEKELVERAIIHDVYSKNIYVDLFASGDFKFGYPFSYVESIKTKDKNTTIFSFLDGVKVHLNRNGHDIVGYVFSEQRSISEVIAAGDYQDIAGELNTTIPIKIDNEIMIIGTKGNDILYNNPNYKSHLIGNGGKNKYVIDMNLDNFSIPEVTIYDPNNPIVYMYDLKSKLKDKLGIDPVMRVYTDYAYSLYCKLSLLIEKETLDEYSKGVLKYILDRDILKDLAIEEVLRKDTLESIWKSTKQIVEDSGLDYVSGQAEKVDDTKREIEVLLQGILDGYYQDNLKDVLRDISEKDYLVLTVNTKHCKGREFSKPEDTKYNLICNLNQGLLVAVQNGDLNEIKDLIGKGYSLDIKDDDGNTPLHLACRDCNYEVVRYFVEEKNARINVKNNNNETPLNLVYECKESEEKGKVINLLQRIQLRLDEQLFNAIKDGDLTKARSFISRGASLRAKNHQGETPLDLARAMGCREIVKILERAQQYINSKKRHRRSVGLEYVISKKESLKVGREEIPVANSSGTKHKSWINEGVAWMKGIVKKLVDGVKGVVSNLFSQFTEDGANYPSDTGNNSQFGYNIDHNVKDETYQQRIEFDKQPNSVISFSDFLSNDNISLLHCIANAMDNHPIKGYQALKSMGVEVIPNVKTAVQFGLREFDSFVNGKIGNLNIEKQSRIKAELKNVYSGIIASLQRGVEYSGNVGLDDVLEKCKKRFEELLPKWKDDIYSTEEHILGIDQPATRLNSMSITSNTAMHSLCH